MKYWIKKRWAGLARRGLSLTLIAALLVSFLPSGAWGATLTNVVYTAAAKGSLIQFVINGTGFNNGAVNNTVMLRRGGQQINASVSSATATSITATVNLGTSLAMGNMDLIVNGETFLNGFYYRYITTNSAFFETPSAPYNSRTPLRIGTYGYFYDGTAPSTVSYGLQFDNGSTTFSYDFSNPLSDYYASKTTISGIDYIQLNTPQVPSPGNYTVQLSRLLTYNGGTTMVNEAVNVGTPFTFYTPSPTAPSIDRIAAAPLADNNLSLQYYGSYFGLDEQNGTNLSADVYGANMEADSGVPPVLYIKGRPIALTKIMNGHYQASIPRDLATGTEVVGASIFRGDGVSSSAPKSITLWADPFHRFGNKLDLAHTTKQPDGTIQLEAGSTDSFQIQASNSGSNNVFGLDPAHTWIGIGNEEATRLLPGNEANIVGAPTSTILNAQLQPNITIFNFNDTYQVLIYSQYGYSVVDQKIKFFSSSAAPTITAVSPRQVERDQNSVTVEIDGTNFISGDTKVTLAGIEAEVVVQSTTKLTATISGTPLSAVPLNGDIVITNGTGAGAKSTTESFQADPTTLQVVYGFRFLSIPDFPNLSHSGVRIIDDGAANYRTQLNDVVVTPTPQLDIGGQQIVQFKKGADLMRGLRAQTRFVDASTGKVYTSAYSIDTYTPDPVSSEVRFRVPDMDGSVSGGVNVNGTWVGGGSFPRPDDLGMSSYFVDVILQNPDGQTITIPSALEIVDRDRKSRPAILQVTPGKTPNTGDKTVLLSGEQFLSSAENPPQVYLGYWPVEVTWLDYQRVKIKTVVADFPNGMNDEEPITLTLINPDGVATTKSFTLLKTASTPGTLTAVLPDTGPANDDSAPIIFLKGSKFTSSVVKAVYFDEFPAIFRPNYTSSTLAVFLPNLPVRNNYTVMVVWENNTADIGPFSTVLTENPILSTLSPNQGPAQDLGFPMATVTITGSGFGSGARIFIGGSEVNTFYARNDTQLQFQVPPLPAGIYDVTVYNPETGGLVTQYYGFIYNGSILSSAPVITQVAVKDSAAVTPPVISSSGGDEVTVLGQRFMVTGYPNQPEVTIAGIPVAAYTSRDTNRIVFTTPAFPANIFPEGQSQVTVPLQVMRMADGVIVESQVVIKRSKPVIDSFSPGGADEAGGDIIYISGTDLRPGLTVRFGEDVVGLAEPGAGPMDVTDSNRTDKKADAGWDGVEHVVWNPLTGESRIKVRVPKDTAYSTTDTTKNKVRLRIFNPDGQETAATDRFTYHSGLPAPQILEVTPVQGSSGGGQPVRIKVTNMVIDYQEKNQWPAFVFGGVEVRPNEGNTNINYPVNPNVDLSKEPVRLIEPTRELTGEWVWEVVVPSFDLGALTEKQVDVMVVNRINNTGGILENGFTYVKPGPPLKLKGITPATTSVEGKITATITAEVSADSQGFLIQNGQTPRVLFGDTEAVVTAANQFELQVTVPAHDVGKVDVIVINPDNSTGILSQAFTYRSLPILTSITPKVAGVAGGGVAVIKGRGFQTGAKVSFGDTEGVVSSVTETEIKVTIPTGPAMDEGVYQQAVDVTVTNPDGEVGVLANGFLYLKDGGIPMEKPILSALAINNNVIKITWPPVNFAQSYEIYRSQGDSSSWKLLTITDGKDREGSAVLYMDKGLTKGTRYYYKVRAISTGGAGPWSDVVSATTKNETGGDYQPGLEPTTTTQSGDGPVIAINTPPGIKYSYDLRNGIPKGGKAVLRWSGDAIAALKETVLVNTTNWRADLQPAFLQQHPYGGSKDFYGSFTAGAVDGRTKDQMAMALKGKSMVSDPLQVELAYEKDRLIQRPAFYANKPFIYLGHKSSYVPRAALYRFEPLNKTWERIGGTTLNGMTYGAIPKSGIYAVVAE